MSYNNIRDYQMASSIKQQGTGFVVREKGNDEEVRKAADA